MALFDLSTLEALVNNFGKRWMGMHVEAHVLHSLAGTDSIGGFMDKIGGVHANNVNAQNLARISVVNDFRQAVGLVLRKRLQNAHAQAHSRKNARERTKEAVEPQKAKRGKKKCTSHLGIGLERSLGNFEGEAFRVGSLAGVLLSQPDKGDFRVRESGRRNGVVIQYVREPIHVLNRADTLGTRRVREHHLPVDIADRPETVYRFSILVKNPHELVARNETPPIRFHIARAQVQACACS